jgi:hypothetical protein
VWWEGHAARNPAIKNSNKIVDGTLQENETTLYQPDIGHGPLSAAYAIQATYPELSQLPSLGKWQILTLYIFTLKLEATAEITPLDLFLLG